MKKLSEILKNTEPISIVGAVDRSISSLELDSRRVGRGALFFALSGSEQDGHDYIGAAVEGGAVAVVCEKLPGSVAEGVTYVVVHDSAVAMGQIASIFYGEPSKKLKLVGITGTNGKTTTATLLYDLFRGLGYKTGLISTIVSCVGDRCEESTHTTPDSITLNRLLSEMVDAGCDYCFMEVSSHSVVQHRIAGLHFTGGVFTNITHDHLDYHGTFAKYIEAKRGFFDALPKGAFALVNVDDKNGEIVVQNTRAKVKRFSLQKHTDFMCKVLETHFEGMLLEINSHEFWVRIIGRFNAYNLLSVYGVAMLLGQQQQDVEQVLSSLEAVSGRLEYVRSPNGITGIVDYAHTPDALQNVIDTINEIRDGESKLYVVVGCGGNRDRTKRPIMAKIAADGGDLAILTSDNPRKEEPEAIIAEMRAGLSGGERYLAIVDRAEAIRTAVTLAESGDVILVAGKGHETYQETDGVRVHFDDKEVLNSCFSQS